MLIARELGRPFRRRQRTRPFSAGGVLGGVAGHPTSKPEWTEKFRRKKNGAFEIRMRRAVSQDEGPYQPPFLNTITGRVRSMIFRSSATL
jgi:hypothetical protein